MSKAESKLVLKDYTGFQKLVSDAYLARPDYEGQYVSSWKALVQHSEKMFNQISTRVDIEFVDYDPYPNYQALKDDVLKNKKMLIYTGHSEHPIFTKEQNIRFRAVHDYLVHIAGDHGFGLRGEIGAYNRHAKVAPPQAHLALFTEVIGQACTFLETGSFPKQKITKLHGFDYIQVGKVDEEKYQLNFQDEEVVSSGHTYSEDFIDAISEWMQYGSTDGNAIYNLMSIEKDIPQHLKTVEGPIYRLQAVAKESYKKLVNGSSYSIRNINSWTLDEKIAEEFVRSSWFSEYSTPGEDKAVIFKYVPKQSEILINLNFLFKDKKFIEAIEEGGFGEGVEYGNAEKEVILKPITMRKENIHSVFDIRKKKFVVSVTKPPSKHIPLKRLLQIKQDNYIGEGGQEYSSEEVDQMILERMGSLQDKVGKLKREVESEDNRADYSWMLEDIKKEVASSLEQTSFLPPRLVMIDAEMTGVDPTKHELLQAAFIKLELKDGQYEEVGEPLVLYFGTDAVPSNDFHKKYLTHIFKLCNQSDLDSEKAKELIHEWLGDWKGEVMPVGDCVIADLDFLKLNNVIDRGDIVDDKPVPGTFHYEIYDLNCLKDFARHKVGEKYTVADLDEDNIHDALVDCRNQTKELNSFIEVLLPDYVESCKAQKTTAMNDDLQSFLQDAGKGYYTYDYLMSPEGDSQWEEQQQQNEDEGREQEREEWAKDTEEFQRESGDPSMIFGPATKLKSTEWLIHFTESNPFDIIESGFRGRDISIIGLTTHYKDKAYPGPLALAYRVEDVPPSYRRSEYGKYGKNAVIFKAKEAARAWHYGDEEYQVVFTNTSAYSMYPVFGDSDGLTLYDPKKKQPVTLVERTPDGLDQIMARIKSKNLKPDETVESSTRLELTHNVNSAIKGKLWKNTDLISNSSSPSQSLKEQRSITTQSLSNTLSGFVVVKQFGHIPKGRHPNEAREYKVIYFFGREGLSEYQHVYKGSDPDALLIGKYRSGNAYTNLTHRISFYVERFGKPDFFHVVSYDGSSALKAVYAEKGKDLIRLWSYVDIRQEPGWKLFEKQAHEAGYKIKAFHKGEIEDSNGYWIESTASWPQTMTNREIGIHWERMAYQDWGDAAVNEDDGIERISNMYEDNTVWTLMKLKISDIEGHHDGHDASDDYIKEYKERKEKGSEFPPLIVEQDDTKPGKYKTIDGQHRLFAAKSLGETYIWAYVPDASVEKIEAAAGSIEWQEVYYAYQKIENSGPKEFKDFKAEDDNYVVPKTSDDFEKHEWERVTNFNLSELRIAGRPVTEPIWTEGYAKPTIEWNDELWHEMEMKKKFKQKWTDEEWKFYDKWADEFAAREYAQLETKAPPIFVVWDEKKNRWAIWNGRHRSRAAAYQGHTTIDAFVGYPVEAEEQIASKLVKGAIMKIKRHIKASDEIKPEDLPPEVQPATEDDGQLPESKKAVVLQFQKKALRADSFQDFQTLLNEVMLEAQLTENLRPSVAGILNEYRLAQGYVAL